MARESFVERLNAIGEKIGDNDELMEMLQGVLTEYDADVVPHTYEEADVMADDGVKWRDKYDDLLRRHRERFFTSGAEVEGGVDEPVTEDDENQQLEFSQLFEEREGDYEKEDDN